MMTRYRSHDTEDVPGTKDPSPLDHAPPEHTMPKGNNESSGEYHEEIDTHCPLAELLEPFWQSTPTAELTQVTDKLQHLTMMLQLYSAPPA